MFLRSKAASCTAYNKDKHFLRDSGSSKERKAKNQGEGSFKRKNKNWNMWKGMSNKKYCRSLSIFVFHWVESL